MTAKVRIPKEILSESSCCSGLICPMSKQEFVNTKFHHPLLMVILMFAGELILLPIGYLMKFDPLPEDKGIVRPRLCFQTKVSDEDRKVSRHNPLVYLIPTLFDVIGSILSFTSLGLLHASTFQILRILCLCFVTLLARIIFKRRLLWRQCIALALIISGLVVVALHSLVEAKQSGGGGQKVKNSVAIGIALMVMSQFILACLGI